MIRGFEETTAPRVEMWLLERVDVALILAILVVTQPGSLAFANFDSPLGPLKNLCCWLLAFNGCFLPYALLTSLVNRRRGYALTATHAVLLLASFILSIREYPGLAYRPYTFIPLIFI